jgi:hypothetical protein
MEKQPYTDKKEIKFSSYISKQIQVGSGAKTYIYEEELPNI